MNLQKQTGEATYKTTFSLSAGRDRRQKAQILVVSENDSIPERLARALPEADFSLEHARDITAGCELARSGRFQVIVTTPLFGDGTWRRLVDIAAHYDLGFVVIVIATTFDMHEWAEALEYGAFDVLDALYELPRVAQSIKCAAWAAYLKGAGPRIEASGHSRAA
jgi:DNA-binding NtrC family response regulator